MIYNVSFCCIVTTVIWLYIYTCFFILFSHCGLSRDIEHGSLCCPGFRLNGPPSRTGIKKLMSRMAFAMDRDRPSESITFS